MVFVKVASSYYFFKQLLMHVDQQYIYIVLVSRFLIQKIWKYVTPSLVLVQNSSMFCDSIYWELPITFEEEIEQLAFIVIATFYLTCYVLF